MFEKRGFGWSRWKQEQANNGGGRAVIVTNGNNTVTYSRDAVGATFTTPDASVNRFLGTSKVSQ